MEILNVTFSELTLRSHALVVRHSETTLERGLEPGEQVIVHDPAVGHWGATVAGLTFGLTETSYRLELGVRLEEDEVLEWATAPGLAHDLSRRDLLTLLGHLRAARQVLTGDTEAAHEIGPSERFEGVN